MNASQSRQPFFVSTSMHTPQDHADRLQNASKSRLERTTKLDRFMTGLSETCPVHLVKRRAKMMGCGSRCDQEVSAYGAFKSRLEFKSWTYCFHCGLPQDRNHNGKQPRCHASYQFKKGGKPCKYVGYIFKVVACMAEDTMM